jgi:dienelactone hydrolase
LLAVLGCLGAGQGHAQISRPSVEQTLKQPVQETTATEFQLQQFLLERIAPPPPPTPGWRMEQEGLRRRILAEIAFHGWPPAWIDSAPAFDDTGSIETGHGYTIHKLRYSVVPGFQANALLYLPARLTSRVPAILNVIGHEPEGVAVEYEQKRCINFAKQGIIALDLEWPGHGELSQPENAHDNAAKLNLVGTNALGFFYLAARRGVDYLSSLPQVDTGRIGMTGLSGGGWQTVLLSALDPRVAVAVEVAGVGSRESNLTHPLDTDEIEANAPDLLHIADYPALIALRAPRPTLLIHNALDDCCFRASLVKPYLYEQIKPFFQLYDAPAALDWHENQEPGTHNYQLDNREQAYRFFSTHFSMPVQHSEIYSDDEIRTPQQLAVGLPAGNLTIAGLAKQLSLHILRESPPAEPHARLAWTNTQREKLRSTVRYEPASVQHAWRLDNGKGLDFRTLRYRYDLSDRISAAGTWFLENVAPPDSPATIVLDDEGQEAASAMVSEHLDRGEQVLTLSLLFQDETLQHAASWAMLADSSGVRPLGLEVGQLVAVADWLRAKTGHPVQVETNGIRSQVISLVAAALVPDTFSKIVNRNAMRSLAYLLDNSVSFRTAPELFCLDLYRYFDLDTIAELAAPVTISSAEFVNKGTAR